MKRLFFFASAALTLLVLFSCARKEIPLSPEARKEREITLPSAKEAWEIEWEKIVKAARKEGKIVVYGPPFPETRQGFMEAFPKAFPGITLEFTSMRGPEASARMLAEHRAGLNIVDIHIGGSTTIVTRLRELALPIKPFLILPEVKDPKVWLGGKLDFADIAEEINLAFTIRADSSVVYNAELVDPRELTSFKDLINPKWKGKIIIQDPRTTGNGLAMASFWYTHKELGLDYIKAFAANAPVLSRDLRFQVESVARGKYSIAVAPDTTITTDLLKVGLPVRWTDIMKEGTYSSSSFGSVIVMDKAPHPNAAIVFLNWLLGKEGQAVWSTTSGLASRRLDAPTGHLLEAIRPRTDVFYMNQSKEENMKIKDEVAEHLIKIFAGF